MLGNMSGKVSMKQIAEAAGVSMMTVSRVMRNQSNVAPETEEKIREIVRRSGYKPNRLVRGMQSGRSGIISVIVPVGHQIAPTILEGIHDFAHERDMILALDLIHHGNTGKRAFVEQGKTINRLLESRVDGFILLPVNEEVNPVHFQEVLDRKIPLVLIDRKTRRFEADFVGTDDYAGGYEAARILARNGCRNPVLISTGESVSTSRLRAEGFRKGVQTFKMKLTTEVIVPNFMPNPELIDHALDQVKGQFDAVFGIADRIAISAWHSCQNLKMKVPSQVKVIGFGALNLRDPRVALSSFDQDPYRIGQDAAKLLFDRIEKGPGKRRPKPKEVLIAPRFVEGTSCPGAQIFKD